MKKHASLAVLCAILVISMPGCAAFGGGATYTYQRQGDNCTVTIESGRTLDAGVDLQLNQCDITVHAGKLAPGSSGVTDLTDLVREIKKQ